VKRYCHIALLALTLFGLLAARCTPRIITQEGTVIESYQVFTIKINGTSYPAYEFEYDGLRCITLYGSYISGLWCEIIER